MASFHCLIISDIIQLDDVISNQEDLGGLSTVKLTNWERLSSENIEDFDIIFLDFKKYIEDRYNPIEHLKTTPQFESKQIYFIFATHCSIYEKRTPYYSDRIIVKDLISTIWKKIPSSESNHGRNIIFINSGHNLSKLLLNDSKFYFYWQWAVEQNHLPKGSYILAKNKKGKIISLIWKHEEIILLILPHPNDKVDYIKNCIKSMREIMAELYYQPNFNIIKPNWLDEYDPFEKSKLIKNKEELNEKIKNIEIYEILLYGHGKPLENAIYQIFTYLGFNDIIQSIDKQDLKFNSSTTKFIAEIKGLKKIATEKKFSQMYKWKVKELKSEQKSKKPNKLLFICNTQWEKHPDKRDSFFHKKIIEDAEYHKWGLLSTLELYKALLKIYNNELSKEEVISKIEKQVGVIKLISDENH